MLHGTKGRKSSFCGKVRILWLGRSFCRCELDVSFAPSKKRVHANSPRTIPKLQSTNPSWLGAEPWSDAACARVSDGTLVSAWREWKINFRWETPKGHCKISLAFSVFVVLLTAPNVSWGMCCIILGRSWTVFLKWSVRLPLAFWEWRCSMAWNLMCFGDGVYCMVLVLETFLLADVAQFLTSFQEFGAAMMVFTVLFAKLDPLYSSVGPSQVNKGLKQIPCMHTFSQADQQNKPHANKQTTSKQPSKPSQTKHLY